MCNIAQPLKLENPVQPYAWGSHTDIQGLMGHAPTTEPWAELWMGAHPVAPSRVRVGQETMPLDVLLRRFPEPMLGAKTADQYDHTLPYLFKLLAAEQPLSIQAHPDSTQAQKGFERENQLKIPLTDPSRNYKDLRHKPECICALTPFTGLKGFRGCDDILRHLSQLCDKTLTDELNLLRTQGLKPFFNALMTLPESQKKAAIQEAVRNAEKSADANPVSAWILTLYSYYPNDIGVLFPGVLNLFHLSPGEALFLPAGELHAYLVGFGIELMANSDNVLRGGLTPKHVDVPELMNVLNFTESAISILRPEPVSSSLSSFPAVAKEFALSVIHVSENTSHVSKDHKNPEILLSIQGTAVLSAGDPATALQMKRGDSVFVPACMDDYTITGNARIYKAGVPA